jgi:hypothetical protein
MSDNNPYNYNQNNREMNELDHQIQNYSNQFNQLREDDFMSRKTMQDDLLNKINQRLQKINRDMNDKIYQENISSQYFQQQQMLNQYDNSQMMNMNNNMNNNNMENGNVDYQQQQNYINNNNFYNQ